MPTLIEQLEALRASSTHDPEAAAIRQRAIDEVANSGIDFGLKVGEIVPDFVLPDAIGRPVASTDFLARGPLVISFYRGEWCPYCNLELRALQAASEALGASIVAISPQRPDNALSLTEKHALAYPVLSDLDQSVIRAFRLQYAIPAEMRAVFEDRGNDIGQQNADGSRNLPISATYVTDALGHVVLAHESADWSVRFDPVQIVDALAELEREKSAVTAAD